MAKKTKFKQHKIGKVRLFFYKTFITLFTFFLGCIFLFNLVESIKSGVVTLSDRNGSGIMFYFAISPIIYTLILCCIAWLTLFMFSTPFRYMDILFPPEKSTDKNRKRTNYKGKKRKI